MRVHVLVEGKSESELIERWAPRAFKGHTFIAHPHQGKGTLPKNPTHKPDPRRHGLLDLLPATLRAYGSSPNAAGDAVLVLVDADREDCTKLKAKLVSLVQSTNPRPKVVIRIAVEETEAFYLGDLRALRIAFPNADMRKARRYQNDSIVGTAELFGEIVADGGLNKVHWAEEMGLRLTTNPSRSTSPSFRALHRGIAKLIAGQPTPGRRSKKHWKARHPGLRK